MKKTLFLSTFLFLGARLVAQNVGIGTNTPDASAKLHIVDANRGILIPNVALTATNAAGPVTAPATSLLVYNTATAGTAPNNVWPGYYYWDGTKWVRLMDNESSDWKLDGNNNGVLRTIGTNDNYDFPIETNGTEKMRVTTAGNVGIATATPGARLDVVGPATGTGITIRAAGGGDVVLNSGGSLFFDGNYSYATGNYIRPIAVNTQTFVTSGAERMRITPAGNVGIGTVAPTQRLHVSGGSILTDRAYAASTLDLAAAAAPNIAQAATQVRITNVAGAQANAITYTATAIEGQYLWITNTDDDAATFAGATIPTNTAMGFVYTGGAWRPVRAMDAQGDWKLDGNNNGVLRTIGTNDNYDFPIETNGTEKMRVTTAGNVGIATSTPPSRLTIGNNLATGALDNFSEYQILLWQNAAALQSYGLGIRGGTMVFNSDAAYQFDEDGVTRVTFAGGGNVGIGNTAPGYALTVTRTTANTEAFLHLEGTGDVNAAGINIRDVDNDRMWHIVNRAGDNNKLQFHRWNAAWQHVMTMDMNSRVGIGATVTAPAVTLSVGGNGANVYATDAWIENNMHVQGNENLNQGGRGRLRVGTAWNYAGIYSDISSTGAANDLILGASSGYVRVGPWAGSNQHLRWANSALKDDQGGSIELGGNNSFGAGGTGTPYIDWHINDGYTRDFDIRMLGTTDANGPVLRMFSHTGATQYFYFDLDWIGAYDCWADVSAWRYFANATNWLYDDVYNDLELIDNIRPKRVQDPKSKEFILINDPKTSPGFLVKPTHNNKDSYAVDITRVGSFSLGAIRMLRRETKSEYEALSAKIKRLENLVEQLTGQKLGEIHFSSTLTLYKDMDKMVIMDVRINPQSKITIKGLSNYRIIDQKEGSFTIVMDAPLSQDTEITYEASFE